MSQPESETFQHYQVLRRADGSLWELGRGAMGVTYKAFDTNLRSHVALKVINTLYLHSETARARFLREARAAAALRHRNVASVYHLGNDDQSFFYAMEFVDGETVAALVERQGPLPVPVAVGITLQVARALGAAHRQNLIHRDIKPANLMVTREDDDDSDEGLGQLHVKVIDFGLARSSLDTGAAGSSGPITMGGFVGTAQFASPEQLEEHELDIRSDIYSLGVTLWFLLAGRPPFTGSMFSLYSQHLTKEPPWGHLGDNLPVPVREVLARMLQKDPADRYQTPAELRRALESCLAALPTGLAGMPALRLLVEDANSEGNRTTGVTVGTDTGTVPPQHPASTLVPPGQLAASAPAASHARPPSTTLAQPGTLLGERFLLRSLVGEGAAGRVFQAQDTRDQNRPVALKLAWSGSPFSAEAMARLEREFEKLRRAPHPHLLSVTELGRHGDLPFLVTEWVNGFTLVDLLRHRGRLRLEDAMALLPQAAAAADHSRTHALEGLDFAPRQVFIQFPHEPATPPDSARRYLDAPMTGWATHALKASALNLPAHEGSIPGVEGATWGGEMTMVGGVRPIAAVASGPPHVRETVGSVARLAYELLDGAPPNPGPAAGARPRYTSLAVLNETANEVLRRALAPGAGPGGAEFASAGAFCEALAHAAGVATGSPRAISTHAATLRPVTLGGQSRADVTSVPPSPLTLPVPGFLTDSPAVSVAAGETGVPPVVEATPVERRPPVTVPVRPARLKSWLPAAGAAALVALAVAGLGFWRHGRQAVEPTPGPPALPAASPAAQPSLSPDVVSVPAPTPVPTPTPKPPPAGPQILEVPGQFATIPAAIAAARVGDTVRVGPGSYPGPITFKEGIRLEGTEVANCLITTGNGEATSTADAALVRVADCRAGSIENFTIQGGGNVGPLGGKRDGILLTNSSVTVTNCRIVSLSGSGIVVHDTLSRPVLKRNTCRLNGEHGLVFERGAGGSAEENVLENNEGCGMIVGDRGTTPTLRANQARDNRRHGLNFLRGSAGTAESNVLIRNGGSGIAVDNYDSVPTLRENQCTGNRQHGLGYARGAGGLAETNILEENMGSGILVHGADTAPVLRNNRSLHNRLNGLGFEKGSAGTAEGNVLEGNEGCGILVSDPLTAPTLTENTSTKNKQFGLATVNAPQFRVDPSNKNVGNTLGAVTKR